MNFNSLSFLLFLPLVVCLYWCLPHKFRWILLLIASYYFYMCWNVKLIFLILTTTAVSYVSGLCMERASNIRIKKLMLGITLFVCLGLLVFFKYADFLLQSIVGALNFFGADIVGISLNILLPVGISFYTFQTLSYVIDVYRGKIRAERHFGYFALFVSYFPQLVAGPIERPENLLPQLKSPQNLDGENVKTGLKFLVSGFVRKCVIADFCGIYVDKVYANLASSNALAVFIASGLFLIQMYNDFAGYSEIAMGAARLMGVKLTRNFNEPLRSKSYTEFFRRWHITLNQWFTDYVYIPLGGSRKGKLRKIVNTLVVFFLCGLWHGADWTYVLWGLTAGIFVCAESVLKKPALKLCGKLHIRPDSGILPLLRWGIVMVLFSLSAILFRAQSISEIITAFNRIFTANGFGTGYWSECAEQLGLNAGKLLLLLLSLSVMILLPKLTECNHALFLGEKRVLISETTGAMFFGIFCIAFCWLALLSQTDASGFQYFQF